MSNHQATVVWNRNGENFLDNKYSRQHVWRFDGGAEVLASASPQVVPLPMSSENAVDPEEAFIASLSSCHMLWFLSLAARRGFVVDSYQDLSTGVMAKNGEGKLAITEVTLRPAVVFSGDSQPGPEDVASLHDRAHESCFIANSVRSTVRCEPQL
jgi:organic hydroperoxide reductase OsmC/OhrA